MRRSELFWGAALVGVGLILLLGAVLRVNMWILVWPLFLVALGFWIIWGTMAKRGSVVGEEAAVPLQGAARARIEVHHGGGRLQIGAGAPPDQLLAGTFGGGLKVDTRPEGDTLSVDMRLREFRPWVWGTPGLDWAFRLNNGVPITLKLETGGNEAQVDLTDLLVTELRLQTGASSTEVLLPAHAGFTRVKVGAGVASIRFRVPAGVAVEFEFEGGLATAHVDTNRFPRVGDEYRSPDYERAANKIEIKVEAGVGSVDLR